MGFKNKVYKIVEKIPTGKVATYKSVAAAVGSPRAYRGVASALAHNFDSKIPCHRVVRSDGFAGGYNRGGITQKIKLLKSEGVEINENRIDLGKYYC